MMSDEPIHTAILISNGDNGAMLHWRALYDRYISRLKPDRRSAAEVIQYIQSKYPTEVLDSAKARKVVELNAAGHRDYLPDGIFDQEHPYDAIVFTVLNEGAGKALYDSQEQDFLDWQREAGKWVKEMEEQTFEKSAIIVGIERNSGYVHAEGSPSLADELIAFQGLNEKELGNIYLVARYVQILLDKGRLE